MSLLFKFVWFLEVLDSLTNNKIDNSCISQPLNTKQHMVKIYDHSSNM